MDRVQKPSISEFSTAKSDMVAYLPENSWMNRANWRDKKTYTYGWENSPSLVINLVN
jgi:hypothetical protein